jgi:MFS family permease
MDGRSKMPFVFWTWLFARGAFVLAPLLHSRSQFVLLVCSTPFVFSVSMPAYTAIMKDIYPDHQRGRLMSYVRMGMSVMTLLTALLMGRLLDHGLSWKVGFFFGGIAGALSAVTFSRIRIPVSVDSLNDRMTTRAFFADTIDILRRNPGYRWFTASVFVSGFGNLVATTLYPIFQVDIFHITNTQVANMQNISSLATIGGFFFWGGFLDRRGPLSTVLLALGFNLAVPLLYAQAWSISALYLASASMGLCLAGIDIGYLNTTLLFAEPGKAAQYQALHSSFFGIRGSIAPQFAIPLMRGIGFQAAFLWSFAIIGAGTCLQMISMRDHRRQHALEPANEPLYEPELAEVE